eukprot:758251-Hanusia_phi.AAC.2
MAQYKPHAHLLAHIIFEPAPARLLECQQEVQFPTPPTACRPTLTKNKHGENRRVSVTTLPMSACPADSVLLEQIKPLLEKTLQQKNAPSDVLLLHMSPQALFNQGCELRLCGSVQTL